jgi:hypothetical protein
MTWKDSLTGKPAAPQFDHPGQVVIYMVLNYFDCDNFADLYYSDLLEAVEEKLRLDAIKHRGLKGLPPKEELGKN